MLITSRDLQYSELQKPLYERRRAISMLGQVGFAQTDDEAESARTSVGIKKLLSMIEMARQEPDSIAERLTGALMGL